MNRNLSFSPNSTAQLMGGWGGGGGGGEEGQKNHPSPYNKPPWQPNRTGCNKCYWLYSPISLVQSCQGCTKEELENTEGFFFLQVIASVTEETVIKRHTSKSEVNWQCFLILIL